jgi:hypothetical protein
MKINFVNCGLSLTLCRLAIFWCFYPIELEIRGSTDTVCFIPWYTHRSWEWEQVNKENLRQWDHLNLTVVNFPFICSNITAAAPYGVYISQLI